MLAIRFARTGRKNAPQFKVVLQEHTVAPGGRHVAVLGSYDPNRKVAVLKADKIKEWIAKGAQASDSAHNLFVREGIIDGKKRAIKMEKPKAKPASNASQSDAGGEIPAEEPARNVSPSDAGGAPKAEVKTEPAHIATQSVAGGEPKAEDTKTEEAKPEPARIATQSVAGGEIKTEEPKVEEPKAEETEKKAEKTVEAKPEAV